MLVRGTSCCGCTAAVLVGLSGFAVCGQSLQFTDVTAESGIDATFPLLLPEDTRFPAMVGGGTVADFNNDGWQDIFLLLGGFEPDHLYINDGDGTFTERAAEWGVAVTHVGSGATVGDYNGDGWIDLFVTSHGLIGAPAAGQHRLYRNNGDGTFSEVAAEAGVAFSSPVVVDGFGAAFGDYDLDGDLDLAVSGWDTSSDGNRLFRNEGDGTFTDVSGQAFQAGVMKFHGFGMRWVDTTNDGWPDLVWAGDGGSTRYLVNSGAGTFVNMKEEAGFTVDTNAMGIAIGDFDGDLDFDVYITNIYDAVLTPDILSGNTLYQNTGAGEFFEEVGAEAGVQVGWWGWGAAAADIDLDGDQDLVATNGWPGGQYWEDPTLVYRNDGVEEGIPLFADVTAAVGLIHTVQGRTLAPADFDNDGDLDLLITANGGPVTLWRCTTNPSNHWLRVFLDTSKSSRNGPNGLGSVVRVWTSEGVQIRALEAGVTYLGQGELSAHFGLGGAEAVDVLEVVWADGRVSTVHDVASDQTITISAPCDADLNSDGVLSIQDFLELHALFTGGAVLADFNGDGSLDILDFLAFHTLYAAGCG